MTKAKLVAQAMEATGSWFSNTTPEKYAKTHTKQQCLDFIAWLYACEMRRQAENK